MRYTKLNKQELEFLFDDKEKAERCYDGCKGDRYGYIYIDKLKSNKDNNYFYSEEFVRSKHIGYHICDFKSVLKEDKSLYADGRVVARELVYKTKEAKDRALERLISKAEFKDIESVDEYTIIINYEEIGE